MSDSPPDEEAIFKVACQIASPDARAAYLNQECAGNPALLQRIAALLRVYEQESRFLESPPPGVGATREVSAPSEKPGTQIGPYKLLQQIGEGGMGIVYMAEQTEPVQRKVALKVIKPGMDSRQVIARFEAERQALSLMDHPNIAKVLDAGTTDSGRPYFVMELVKGQPITQFCDEKHLTPRQRLELLLPVCQAIQHAHQKGIIHRDIKPTNILVAEYDQQPVPKVIDFGVAKATSQTLTEKTMFTGLGQIVGTLEYMSPEQAKVNQLDIDTRSDIYSLGVLLYELLTGSTPFNRQRLRSAAFDEMLRIIREEEPEKPSTRLSSADALPSIAANRNMEPARLGRTVRGELDWIVMKALEKDRGRRYETPSGLAVDIQNYLNDEPVVACPPSAWYRFRKFARRNKRTLATATLLGMTLVIALGAVAGTVGWAMRNRTALEQQVALDRATRQAALELEVNNALEESSEWFARDKLPEAHAAVKRAEGLLASSEATQELHDRTRQWRTDLDMVAQLEDIRLKRVVVQFRPDKFDADRAYREAFREYGVALEAANPLAAAEQIRASKVRDRLVAGMEDWVVMKTTSSNVKQIAGYKELLAVLRQADPDPWRNQLRELVESRDRKAIEGLARSEKFLAQSPATVHLLAATLDRLGSRPLASDVLRQAQRQHPGDFWINFALANVVDLNRSDEGIAFFRAALALRPENVEVHWLLGYALGQRGYLAEAEALLREALRLAPNDAMVRIHLGTILLDQFRVPEAESVYRECLQAGQDSDLIRIRLGRALHGQGKLAEAEVEYQEAIRRWPGSAQSHGVLASFLQAQDRLPEAEVEHREAVRLVPRNYLFHLHLGGLLQEVGKLDEAEAEFREAIRLAPNYASPQTLDSLLPLRRLAKETAEFKEAVRLNPNDARARQFLGRNLHGLGKPAEAEVELLEAVRLQPTNAGAHSLLGEIYTQRAKWDKAAAAFTRSLESNPDNVYTWQQCAVVRLRSGDLEAYHSACRELLERFSPTDKSTFFANQVALTCLLGEKGDPQRVRKLVEQALAVPEPQRSLAQMTKALLDYRSGRHTEAADGLKRLATATPYGSNNPRVYIVLSMAQHLLGQDVEARAALVRARAMIWLGPRPVVGNVFDTLCTQILCREAEALLKIDDKAKLKSAAK